MGLLLTALPAPSTAAQERDPSKKDPTIDFDTVDLMTLPPLQYTFVPERRKLEGFRKHLASGAWEEFQHPAVDGTGFCSAFWEALRTGEGIEAIEPVLMTNDVDDVASSALAQSCPQYNFSHPNHRKGKVAYGVRLYQIKINDRIVFFYEHGDLVGGWASERPIPFSEISRRISNTRYERVSVGRDIDSQTCQEYSGLSITPFYTITGYGYSNYKSDGLHVLFKDDMFYLDFSFDHDLERQISLKRREAVINSTIMGYATTLCTKYNNHR
jgi:hypothetical protein